MGRPLIVLGDTTSHGGTVIGADFTFEVHGKHIARVGRHRPVALSRFHSRHMGGAVPDEQSGPRYFALFCGLQRRRALRPRMGRCCNRCRSASSCIGLCRHKIHSGTWHLESKEDRHVVRSAMRCHLCMHAGSVSQARTKKPRAAELFFTAWGGLRPPRTDLPADMISTLGTPLLVTSPEQIVERIYKP